MNARQRAPTRKGGKKNSKKPANKPETKHRRTQSRNRARDDAIRLAAAVAANPDAPDDQLITLWNPYGITYGDCRRIWRFIVDIATARHPVADPETINAAIAAARVATTMVAQCQRDPKNNPARDSQPTNNDTDDQPDDDTDTGQLRLVGDQPLILRIPTQPQRSQ